MQTVMNQTTLVRYSVSDAECLSSNCTCPGNYILEKGACRYFPHFNVDLGIEALFVIGLILLSASFISLNTHLQSYAHHMSERRDLTNSLVTQNDSLEKELMRC